MLSRPKLLLRRFYDPLRVHTVLNEYFVLGIEWSVKDEGTDDEAMCNSVVGYCIYLPRGLSRWLSSSMVELMHDINS